MENELEIEIEKKKSPIEIWRDSLTDEQKEAHKIKLSHARTAAAKKVRETKIEVEKKAQALLPVMFAEQLKSQIDGRDFSPNQETIQRLRFLMDRGMTIKEMRGKYFSDIEQAIWDKILKFLFRDQVANTEELALSILNSQQKLLKDMERQLKSVKREVRGYKKRKDSIPMLVLGMELKLSEKIYALKVNVSEAMLNLGVVGEKQKNASINIHMSVPRPEKIVKDIIEVV